MDQREPPREGASPNGNIPRQEEARPRRSGETRESSRTHPDDLPAARARIRNIQRKIRTNPIYGDALSRTNRPAQKLPPNRISVAP